MNDNLINIIDSFDKEYNNINKKLNCFTSNLSEFARTAVQHSSPKDILYGKLIAIKDNLSRLNDNSPISTHDRRGESS